jgi:hypothetical protein
MLGTNRCSSGVYTTDIGKTQNGDDQMSAPDLSKTHPRSPRETLGGYVIVARTLDKCRAKLNGSNGEYHFDCPLDNQFFDFAGITVEDFKSFVATGADDDAVGKWVEAHGKQSERIEVINWNNKMRGLRIAEMPDPLQEFLEGYIPEFLPANKPVYCWFDVYDIEEGRI